MSSRSNFKAKAKEIARQRAQLKAKRNSLTLGSPFPLDDITESNNDEIQFNPIDVEIGEGESLGTNLLVFPHVSNGDDSVQPHDAVNSTTQANVALFTFDGAPLAEPPKCDPQFEPLKGVDITHWQEIPLLVNIRDEAAGVKQDEQFRISEGNCALVGNSMSEDDSRELGDGHTTIVGESCASTSMSSEPEQSFLVEDCQDSITSTLTPDVMDTIEHAEVVETAVEMDVQHLDPVVTSHHQLAPQTDHVTWLNVISSNDPIELMGASLKGRNGEISSYTNSLDENVADDHVNKQDAIPRCDEYSKTDVKLEGDKEDEDAVAMKAKRAQAQARKMQVLSSHRKRRTSAAELSKKVADALGPLMDDVAIARNNENTDGADPENTPVLPIQVDALAAVAVGYDELVTGVGPDIDGPDIGPDIDADAVEREACASPLALTPPSPCGEQNILPSMHPDGFGKSIDVGDGISAISKTSKNFVSLPSPRPRDHSSSRPTSKRLSFGAPSQKRTSRAFSQSQPMTPRQSQRLSRASVLQLKSPEMIVFRVVARFVTGKMFAKRVSVLHSAYRDGAVDIVKKMMAFHPEDAEVRDRRHSFRTTFQAALCGGHEAPLALSILRALEVTAADVLECDVFGNNLIHYAVLHTNLSNFEMVNFLEEVLSFSIVNPHQVGWDESEEGAAWARRARSSGDAKRESGNEGADAPLLSGWLYKLGRNQKWQLRYFSLMPKFIKYSVWPWRRWKSSGDTFLLDKRFVSLSRSSCAVDVGVDARRVIVIKLHSGHMSTRKMTDMLVLCARNDDQLREWWQSLSAFAKVEHIRSEDSMLLCNFEAAQAATSRSNVAGNTPLHLLALWPLPLVGKQAQDMMTVAAWLMNSGCPVNARNAIGKTALQIAVEAGNELLARYLHRRGADPLIRDCAGRSIRDVTNDLSLVKQLSVKDLFFTTRFPLLPRPHKEYGFTYLSICFNSLICR